MNNLRLLLLAGWLLFSFVPLHAQENPPDETIQIGLSTDTVTIAPDFDGAELTIFGAVDNVDPLVQRQGRYDIVVILEGPSRNVVVRRKERVLGVWVNLTSSAFVNVPASYAMAMTRQKQDITSDESYRQLALGPDALFMRPANLRDTQAKLDEFRKAYRDLRFESGLYSEQVGNVEFLSQNLFRARLSLPANVPLGFHRARAFLFKRGQFVSESSAGLQIVKSGFEQWVYRFAHDNSLLYGISAVLIAMLTGWLGRVMFKRD